MLRHGIVIGLVIIAGLLLAMRPAGRSVPVVAANVPAPPECHYLGPDCQMMYVTHNGKYFRQIFPGFQRPGSGVFAFRQDTPEPIGNLPNFGGHHDFVLAPSMVEHRLRSRCPTL